MHAKEEEHGEEMVALMEMKGELEELNENIERVAKDLDKVNVEKYKMELKLKHLENKYFDVKKTHNACTVC
jgi:predicted nuclease with TOPRIM domain